MTPIAAIVKPHNDPWVGGFGTLIAIGNAGEMYATAEPDEIVVHIEARILRGFKHDVGKDIPYSYTHWVNRPTGERGCYFEPEMDTFGT